jgi:hypothetical protein
LCINQNDLFERGKQVSLMRDIYKSARAVFGSHSGSEGYSEENLELAFKIVKPLCSSLRRAVESGTEPSEVLQEMNSQTKAFGPIIDCLYSVVFFISSEYFKRVWIVQEICLARRLIFIHHEHAMQWDDFVAVLQLLEDLKNALQEISGKPVLDVPSHDSRKEVQHPISLQDQDGRILMLLEDVSHSLILVGTLNSAQTMLKTTGFPLPLELRWRLSVEAFTLGASNPRDYIFGMLALSEHDIEPNYTESVQLKDLYIQYCLCWINDVKEQGHYIGDAIDLLHFGGLHRASMALQSGHKRYDMPTWAPLFYAGSSGMTFNSPFRGEGNWPHFQTWPDVELLREKEEMLVSGISIDEILIIAPDSVSDMIDEGNFFDLCDAFYLLWEQKAADPNGKCQSQFWKNLFQSSTDLFYAEENFEYLQRSCAWLGMIGVFDHLMMEDGIPKLGQESKWITLGESTHQDFKAWYTEHFSSKALDPEMFLSAFSSVVDSNGKVMDTTTSWWQVLKGCRVQEEQRRLFITQDGLIGCGPSSAEPDDLVVVVKQAESPYIFRRAADKDHGTKARYQFVSNVYMPCLGETQPEWVGMPQRFTLI